MSDLTDEELNRIVILAPARSHLETVAHELLMLRSARPTHRMRKDRAALAARKRGG